MEPGWYPLPDRSGRMGMWNGSGWVDPFEAFEDKLGEQVGHHLERMYRLGFDAGASAAAQVLAYGGVKP